MKSSKLDGYCKKIFEVLILKGKLYFNELYGILEKEMAKPTLSLHLKHLVAEGFVVRKVEDVLKVSYRINEGKFAKGKSFERSVKEIGESLRKDIENFAGLSLDEKVANVWSVMIVRALNELKARINFEVDPSWQNEMLLSMWKDRPLTMENWLVRLCKEDKKFREGVLEQIDRLILKVRQ